MMKINFHTINLKQITLQNKKDVSISIKEIHRIFLNVGTIRHHGNA